MTGWPSSARSRERRLERGIDRVFVGAAGAAEVGPLPAERRVVGRAQILGARNQVVVDVTPLPVELIDGPGRQTRLLKRADCRRVRPGLLRQRVARGDELAERQLIQAIERAIGLLGARHRERGRTAQCGVVLGRIGSSVQRSRGTALSVDGSRQIS